MPVNASPTWPAAPRAGLAALVAVSAALLAACANNGGNTGAASAASAPATVPGARAYPLAVPRPVLDGYHGQSVRDDFQWLENPADPATRAWVAAENAYSRAYLDAMPARAGLQEKLQALMSSTSNAYTALREESGLVFALKNAPPRQQPMLVAMTSVDDPGNERVVFDPNAVAKNGSLAIDFFRPSEDARRVAISVSEGGSEDGTLRFVDVSSGQELIDRIPRVAYATGGGDVAWGPGSEGVYYTRYPDPGSRPEADMHFYQQVWYHKLGTPVSEDRLEVGAEFPRIAEVRLQSSHDGRIVTALVANGDGGDFSLWLKVANARGAGTWRRIAADEDGIKAVRIGDDNALYVRSLEDAPRGKILRLPVSAATREVKWSRVPVVVPQSDGTIEDMEIVGGTVYVSEQLGGPSRLRAVEIGSRRATTVALPPVTGVRELARIGRREVVANLTSYLAPAAWTHVSGKAVRRTALVVSSDVNYNDCEVVRDFATSRDGTKIPLNIVRRKGTRLDGHNPTILYGYGGYGVNMTPGFNPALRVWLDRGGVYAVANIRGGGEYGEAWHRAGNLLNKQNVFDDFLASAEFLVKSGYSEPRRLGIMGGSNGGLLMGAASTQRPELFRAVVGSVGIYDMLRVERDPNGAFNVTEFGSVQDKAQFEALHAYSPYHRVKDGVDYPAILMLTGDNDGRVNPAHSRKMIARLQQADPGGRPILLRTSASSGHGIGTALGERIAQAADIYGFFVNELTAGLQ